MSVSIRFAFLRLLSVALFFSAAFVPSPAAAQAFEAEYRIYLDTDNTSATGCNVPTPDGVFAGAEQVLISRRAADRIVEVVRQECVASTGGFTGGEIPVSEAGQPVTWDVGRMQAADGADVVETYFPLSASPGATLVRVGVVASDLATGEDALLTDDGTGAGNPILIVVGSITEIPTLSPLALTFLALLLAGAAALAMRRRSRQALLLAVVVGAASVAGVAWAANFVLDGFIDDWAGEVTRGFDFEGDGPPRGDLLRAFAEMENDLLFFRLDLVSNSPPVAQDDAVATDANTVLNGDVLADNGNGPDSDPDGDPLTVTEVDGSSANVGIQITLASGALLTVNANGTFSYDPNGQFGTLPPGTTAQDVFDYRIEDGAGGSDTATVTVTITGLNDCPTAVDDAVTTDEDTVLAGDVLADNGNGPDSDPDGDPLTVIEVNGNPASVGTQITLPSGALLTVNADGTFSYDPNGAFDDLAPGATDTDTFTYTIDDGSGTCAETATVTITITGVNDCPTAVDDAVTTDEDTVLAGDVLASNPTTPDSDPEGDTLTVTAVNGVAASVGTQITLASGALLTVNADGTFSYDPNGAFDDLASGASTTDTFTYTIDDGSGTCAETATVTITVTGVNDCPTAVDDAVTTDEDTVLAGDVLAANPTTPDSDPEGDTLTVTEVNGNAADVGVQITLASGALLTVNADGTFSYDPNGAFDSLAQGATDTDTFTYTIDDGSGTCAETATVTITITGVNDCPTAVDDAVTTSEDAVLAGDVLVANPTTPDSDPEGDPLTVTEVNGVAASVGTQITLGSGALLTVNANGTFSYDPNGAFDSLAQGATGTDSFTYTIDDGSGTCAETATVTITVTGVNDCPTAVDDAVTTDEDSVLNGNALAANPTTPDSDPEGDTLNVIAVNGNVANVGVQIPLGAGLLTVNANGTFSFDPNGGYESLNVGDTAVEMFTYTIDDGSTTCAETATVTVTITGVNDMPMLVGMPVESFDTLSNTLLEVAATRSENPAIFMAENLLDNFVDPDGPNPLQVTASNVTAGATVNMDSAAGTFTYLSPAGRTAADTFDYTVSDGLAGVTRTITISFPRRVWYVDNTAAAGGLGRSSDPFDTLAEAETAAADGDTIFVYEGDATTAGQDQGITLLDGQRLIGQGVALSFDVGLNGNPAPTLPFSPALPIAEPMVENTLDAVVVDASAGNRENVEIRGLNLASSLSAIEVTAGGANNVSVLIGENTISLTEQDAIDVNANSTGTVDIVSVDNEVETTLGNGVNITTTAGTTTVAVQGGLTLRSNQDALVIDGAAGGTTFVTSLAGVTIDGNSTMDGVRISDVTFDADPATASFQTVMAGVMAVGSPGNGVGNGGVILTNVSGDLSFTDLDIVADAGAGLEVTGSGVFNGGAGTGFRITAPAGSTVSAVGGPAVDLDPLTANLTFDALNSTNSTGFGVSLVDVTGTFDAATGSISGSAGTAFNVLRGNVDATYSGNITNASGRVIDIDSTPATSDILFDGASISDNGGQGARIFGVSGSVTLSAATTTIQNSSAEGILVAGATGGTIRVDDTTLTNCAGGCLDVNVSGGTTPTVDLDNVDINQATNAARAVRVNGMGGGTVNFDSASGISATDGTGILISNNISPTAVTFSGPVDLGTGASRLSDGTAFTMSANGAVTVSFANLDAFTSGVTGIATSGGGTLNTTTGRVDSNNGRALDLGGIDSGVVLADVNCSFNSDCVRLNSISGTTTLSGVNLNCTGGTCFDSDNGGTLAVLGSGNTIDATGGPGLDFLGTTIAGAGVIFESIDVNNAATGITLALTGNGGTFTVTGDGGTTRNGSGGVIQNITGDGIVLTSAFNVSLEQIRLRTTGDGIDSNGGGNLAFTALDVDPVNGDGWRVANLTGSNSVTGSLFAGVNNAGAQAIGVAQSGATVLTELAIDSSIFQNSSTGAAMVGISGQGTSNTTVVVRNGSIFEGLFGTGFQSSAGDTGGSAATINTTVMDSTFRNAAANGTGEIFVTTDELGTNNFTISGNTVSGVGLPNFNAGVIQVQSTGGTVNGTVSGNDIDNITGRRAIQIVGQAPAGETATVMVTVTNNDIDNIPNDEGILFDYDANIGAGSHVTITNNRLGQSDNNVGGGREAIEVRVRPDTNNRVPVTVTGNTATSDTSVEVFDLDVEDSGVVSATITGNTFSDTSAAGANQVVIDAEDAASVLCLSLSGNTTVGGINNSISLTENGGTHTVVNLAGVTGANSAGTVSVAGGVADNGGPCP